MKVKGYRVNPAELEGHLLEHPDVLDCCVIPIPDEFSGEIPKAFIVPSKEVQDHLDNLDLEAVDKLKTTLIQVCATHLPSTFEFFSVRKEAKHFCSMLQIIKLGTSTWREVWNFATISQRRLLGSCFVEFCAIVSRDRSYRRFRFNTIRMYVNAFGMLTGLAVIFEHYMNNALMPKYGKVPSLLL